jgi:uncharacterized protein with NRDE domain
MCLILLAWRVRADYPLVLAANRDELHARAAASAGWWTSPRILAGRDLSAGGAWLAVTEDGRFAALTNYRDPTRQRPAAPSRGELVPMILDQRRPVTQQLQELHRIAPAYNDFNVLFSDGERVAVYESIVDRGRVLEAGVYGLSNHVLDTPWPKVVSAKAALAAALTRLPDESALLELLRDDRPADDHELPRTGLSLEWERLLSSAFIRSNEYGTRCSTIVLIDQVGEAQFTEWTWSANGALAGEAAFRFRLSDASASIP